MLYVGVDLAWGGNRQSGLAVLDAAGCLVDAVARLTDDDLVAWLAPHTRGACVVGFDAPLVMTNLTGGRPCERELSRWFRAYDAGAYLSNLSQAAFANGPRAGRLAAALGLETDPDVPTDRRALEVYPHAATVTLLGLSRTLKYKARRGRSVAARRLAFTTLLDHLESLESAAVPLRVAGGAVWHDLRRRVREAPTGAALDRVEDVVDAVICAHVAHHFDRRPELTHVFGDGREGFIVTPVTPEMKALLTSTTTTSLTPPYASS